LRITRLGDQTEANRFCAEVWNPFLHKYQPVAAVQEGVARVDDRANLIGPMWVERHPKRDALKDVPSAVETGARWAELRINGTAFRSYDTRSDDRPIWARATSMKQATTAICTKVGMCCAVQRRRNRFCAAFELENTYGNASYTGAIGVLGRFEKGNLPRQCGTGRQRHRAADPS
jgi:hypothetical protein